MMPLRATYFHLLSLVFIPTISMLMILAMMIHAREEVTDFTSDVTTIIIGLNARKSKQMAVDFSLIPTVRTFKYQW